MDEFPSITDLFEFLEDDKSWNEIGKSYLFIGEVIGKCIKELFAKREIEDNNERRDIDDYRFFAGRYLVRSGRIFKSIVLLSIYHSIFEAEMLSRPLLENIAETKYFLKSRRAKSIRKIKLYELINEKRRYESTYGKDFDKFTDKNGHVISSKYFIESGESLRKKIKEGLLNYSDEEFIKMEDKIEKNFSWHGLHRKALFKRVNMEDKLEQYEASCKFLHIREERPFIFGNDNEFYAKGRILGDSLLMLEHIKDFIKLCPSIFSSSETINDLEAIFRDLNKTLFEETKDIDPRVFEFVKLIPVTEYRTKETTLIECLGFLYGLAKDIKNYITWSEEIKVVDREWLEKSGFRKIMESIGYRLLWSRPDKIGTGELDGYEIIFEIDKPNRLRRRIERRDSVVLLGKKEDTKR